MRPIDNVFDTMVRVYGYWISKHHQKILGCLIDAVLIDPREYCFRTIKAENWLRWFKLLLDTVNGSLNYFEVITVSC